MMDVANRDANLLDMPWSYLSLDDFCSNLHKCTSKKDIFTGRKLYLLLVFYGLDSISIVGDHIIRLFVLCGSFWEADKAFWKIAQPSACTWHAIISAFASHKEMNMALGYYDKMVESSIIPDSFIFTCLLKACAAVGTLLEGRLMHGQLIQFGLQTDLFVASTLIHFYAKCGNLEEAHSVFDRLPQQNVVTWGALIAGYIQQGFASSGLALFQIMYQEGTEANEAIFSCIFKACSSLGDLDQGMRLHSHVTSIGLEADVVIGNSLINMYALCDSLEESQAVFDQLPDRSLLSWNTMISGCVLNDHGSTALELYERMQADGVSPNNATFSCMLKICAGLGSLEQGKLIHDQLIKDGTGLDVFIGSSLIDMYCKCGNLEDARKIFDDWPDRNVVMWGAMITGYTQHGYGHVALELFKKMQEHVMPNEHIFSSILKACACEGAILQGKSIHQQILKGGFGTCNTIGSSLIDMYAKCGNMDAAHKVFEDLSDRNVVSWGAMITGYVQQGRPLSALQLLEKMHHENINPDKVIFGSVLEACGSIGATEQSKLLHHQVILRGFDLDEILGNILIDVYVKFGCIEEAHSIFDNSRHRKNILSWTSMICASAEHGNFSLVREFLKDMSEQRLMPDGVMFMTILRACSHGGHVEEGTRFFRLMTEVYDIKPAVEHLGCMVDLLGQEGYLIEAEELLESMPLPPDCTAWTSLLSACRKFGNVVLGRICFDQAISLDSELSAGYVLMANIYADAGMWEHVGEIQELRNGFGAWKMPGRAWIEVDKKVHEFVVGDRSHPLSDNICASWKRLKGVLRERGHIPQVATQSVPTLNNREESLFEHCEKLAIAFGLLSTPKGATIRVVKNLRVCSDCHSVSKILSKVEKREIIIKDSHCVHQFSEGLCSCGE